MHLACDFNCYIETEGHSNVTGSHIHCKSGNMLEMVQDRNVNCYYTPIL